MPVYIEKYGDLFGCHNSETTRKDRATQPMDHGRLRWAIPLKSLWKYSLFCYWWLPFQKKCSVIATDTQPSGLIFPLQVLVINSKRKVTKPPPLAITVFARQPNTGWRSKTSGGKDIFDKQCRDYPGKSTECIQEKTFDFDEIIKNAFLYYDGRENISLMEPRNKSWNTHFTSMMFGRGYTLHFDWNASAEYHHVYLYLNTSFKYTIFVHDPKYFLVTKNYLALPILFVTFDPKQSFSYFEQLVVTEHHLLDNCNPEPDYNFNKCIQEVKKLK